MNPGANKLAVPGIAALYAERLANAQEEVELEPVQLWLPCVSGPPDNDDKRVIKKASVPRGHKKP